MSFFANVFFPYVVFFNMYCACVGETNCVDIDAVKAATDAGMANGNSTEGNIL